MLGVHRARPRRPVAGRARCTAAAPATCSTRSSRAASPSAERRRADDAQVADEPATTIFSVAIVGRPNVGKSTLFNRLIGDDRSVVHDMPGTTRDAIDTVVETPDGPVRFVDTAGMRRKSQDRRGHRVLLVGARAAGDRRRRRRAARHRRHRGRHRTRTSASPSGSTPPAAPIVRAAQQVGAARRAEQRAERRRTRSAASCTSSATSPVLKITALTGKGVHKLLPALADAIERLPPPGAHPGGQRGDPRRPSPPSRRPHGGRGSSTPRRAPPTRRRSRCSPTGSCPPTYLRYLERKLREAFDFGSTPIKLRVRKQLISASVARHTESGPRSVSHRVAESEVLGAFPGAHGYGPHGWPALAVAGGLRRAVGRVGAATRQRRPAPQPRRRARRATPTSSRWLRSDFRKDIH